MLLLIKELDLGPPRFSLDGHLNSTYACLSGHLPQSTRMLQVAMEVVSHRRDGVCPLSQQE